MSKCSKCEKELSTGDIDGICGECRYKQSNPSIQPYYTPSGWLCPRCGRGNSPHSNLCPCIPLPPIQFTCSTWRNK